MTVRALYLCEGSSDTGLRFHIEAIAADMGREILVTVPELDRLPNKPGHSVVDKLRAAQQLSDAGHAYDLVVIHRDSDREPPDRRRREIADAVAAVSPGLAHVPVIPVRMLEAWLLLDQSAIREVAGNPNGKMALDLPKPARAESVADPKALLKQAIATASGEKGRGLQKLQTRFSANRARLLQMLDRKGPVKQLASWQSFTDDLREVLECGH
ncbi:hypothetical protein GCM10010451_17630 [Streptomyces virens]|uniref:DUF4276 family protein n=1 Tax=Streptomyces virens TaxID=285572 RepID=A0ABP6P6D3_9ACTN|nr:hypothetical protein [Streptomyces calvus]MBA8978664.1 hypothetical protein [Streptomyces calvus]MYS26046.1 hypothetical protein [Streptomyces sp. SID7804]